MEFVFRKNSNPGFSQNFDPSILPRNEVHMNLLYGKCLITVISYGQNLAYLKAIFHTVKLYGLYYWQDIMM